MRRTVWIVLGVEITLVAALAVAIRSGRMPLGVPGQWEWQRVRVNPSILPTLMGLAAVAAYATFAAAGYCFLSAKQGQSRVKSWLAGLVLASVAVQGLVQEAAPDGYGLSKWIIALHSPGSSGYYTVASTQMGDPGRFLANYPTWIDKQDSLHVGTHPPGLFLMARMILEMMQGQPTLARWVCENSPPSVSSAIRMFRETTSLPRADSASLVMTGVLTLLACASTVLPLYWLARSSLPEPAAWASATFWPLVPSALMFQPTADSAFPLLSTTALALASWAICSPSRRGLILCVASGFVMALGMFFTLAFLPVGLVVALILLRCFGRKVLPSMAFILATGLGFFAGTFAWAVATSANPFLIWWVNQRNHARFYVEYPRNYLAWVVENPIELAIALGLPATVWAVIGFHKPGQMPRVAWATLFVLAILTISGKNLSEVARLWLPLMPPLLVASGSSFSRLGGDGRTLGITIALVGLQALILQATIQLVYPI